MAEKNYPKLRFKGFSEPWEQRRLFEIATFSKGKGYSKSDLTESGNEVILYGHMYTKYEVVINDVDAFVNSSRDNVLSEQGDVIVPSSGETAEDISRASVVGKPGVIIGSDLNVIKPYDEVNSLFLALTISNGKQQKELIKRAQGKSIVHLHNSDLEKVILNYPSLEEQTKIGNFFKKIDDLIVANQTRIGKLGRLKRVYLQRIFGQELRFKGYSQPWEQHKLGEAVSKIKSYSLSREVETEQETGYKYIHYGDIHTGVADLITNDKVLPHIRSGEYELLSKNDIIVADASEDYQGIAEPSVILDEPKYKLVSGLHTIALRPKKVSSLFIYYLLHTEIFKKYGYKVGTGMKVFGISYLNLSKFESFYPGKYEQIKVGNFFRELDNLIIANQIKVDLLKKLKKAYLQKMFL